MGKPTTFLARSPIDEDVFHVGYRWTDRGKFELKRLAFSIHIDDIEGVFGEDTYIRARNLEPGEAANLQGTQDDCHE